MKISKILKNSASLVYCLLIMPGAGISNLSTLSMEDRFGEFLVDTTIVYVSESDVQTWNSIAASDSCFLAVWTDLRNDTTENIYGTRIALDGTIMDHTGINICSAINYQEAPSCASNGSQFLVTWSDTRNGWTDIYGARIDQNGTVLDTLGIPICTASLWQYKSAVSFDGANYLVTWTDHRNSPGADTNMDIYGTFVTSDGIVYDTIGFQITKAYGRQRNPSIAFDGTNYLVVWHDERNDTADIYGARVTLSGIVLDTNGIPISCAQRYQEDPSVVFGDQNYFVAWQDWRIQANSYDVYGTRVTTDGIVLDTSGIPIINMNRSQWAVSLGFDGTNYLIAWQDERTSASESDIYCSRVSQSGQVLDSGGVAVSVRVMSQSNPTVAYSNATYCITWDDLTGNPLFYAWDIWGARVNESGIILDTTGFIVSTVINPQRTPAIAFDGINYLCVWRDDRSILDSADIFGSRITHAGVILDSIPIAICNNQAKGQFSPSVAFDDSNYMVVWETLDSIVEPLCIWKIFAVKVNPSGILLDTADIYIGQSTYPGSYKLTPDIDFCNPNYLVPWGDQEVIYGILVSRGGAIIDSNPLVISPSFGDCYNPAVNSNDNIFLVVYESYDNYSWNIRGTRVTPGGTILDPGSIPISIWPGDQMRPDIISNNTSDYFVVWQDLRSGNWDIYGARVTSGGVTLDTSGIAICTSPGDQLLPVVSYDGTYYIVIWQDFRNNADWQIYGAKVDTSGILVNTYEISIQPGNQLTPALTNGNNDQILMVYSGWTDSTNSNIVKTTRIWGKFYPITDIYEIGQAKAKEYGLHVIPNPSREDCYLQYALTQTDNVDISLYDATGRLVKNILRGKQDAGFHDVKWSTKNLAQGVYFIKMMAGEKHYIKKIIFVK